MNHQRDQWLQDAKNRQRNIVFPETVENERRFWQNLGTGVPSTSTKVGLVVLAVFVFGLGGVFLAAAYQGGILLPFLAVTLLLAATIFGIVAIGTRRARRRVDGTHKVNR